MNITLFLPIISAFFVLFLGLFVFFKDVRSRINWIFLTFSIVNFIWFFGTFMIFLGRNVFFWDKFVYVGVVFIPALVFHFVMLLLNIAKNKRALIVLGYVLSLEFLAALLFTDSFTNEAFYYKWGAHLKAEIFHHIFLIFFALYIGMLFRELFRYHNTVKDNMERNKIRYVILAMFFLTMGSFGFLPAYEISVYPVSYLSGLFFSITTGYAITKYQLLRIKTFAAQFLIVSMNIIAFSYIFVSKDVDEYITKTIFFVGVLLTSYLLKKSFDKEFEQRAELQILTNKLAKNNEKLKALDRAKNEFISITAHQLRTPPTVIKGYITLAQEDPNNKLDDETKESLERALISNERLIDLVEDILNVSRIESGNMKYDVKEDQVFEGILDELYDAFSLKAKDKGIELILNKPSKALPNIAMDRKKIREVVSNLVDNAIKYTRKGSVEITAKEKGGNVRIEIKDSGVGITKEDMPELFKKFSRGKNPGRLGAEGTGLGIFVGKKIVEDHGGKIWAESDGPNKGSTFIIEIPIDPEKNENYTRAKREAENSKSNEAEEFVENI